jgi:hypothetical protein
VTDANIVTNRIEVRVEGMIRAATLSVILRSTGAGIEVGRSPVSPGDSTFIYSFFSSSINDLPPGQYIAVTGQWTDPSVGPPGFASVDFVVCDTPEKNYVRNEYMRLNRSPVPACGDLRSDYDSPHFHFPELNHNGYHSVAWIQPILTTSLESIRDQFGESIRLSGGYRCPEKQNDVDPTHPNGFHQFGLAADLIPDGYSIDSDWWNAVAAIVGRTNNGFVNLREKDHVHADWGQR